MTNPLLLLVLAASTAHAGALAELRLLAGDMTVAVPPAVKGAPVKPAVSAAPAAPPVIRVTDVTWNPAFPLDKKAVEAAGLRVGTKKFARYSCEYASGAAAARCDFAYDVWPEMCWYGWDHVIADLPLDGTAPAVVSKGWRAD